jgi:hypothetical protein
VHERRANEAGTREREGACGCKQQKIKEKGREEVDEGSKDGLTKAVASEANEGRKKIKDVKGPQPEERTAQREERETGCPST